MVLRVNCNEKKIVKEKFFVSSPRHSFSLSCVLIGSLTNWFLKFWYSLTVLHDWLASESLKNSKSKN